MVSEKVVSEQLKRINFKRHGWGKGELNELAHILLPEEEIYECVNGIYEGGFALLVATDLRVLLIDKKPLNFLTVEDLRFDMINEMDYNHRLFGANISISAGNKNLQFRSYNQPRLRKLIGHVQHCMADTKKQANGHQEDQKLHLEKINEQLQAYLVAQQNHQLQLQLQQMQLAQQAGVAIQVPQPAPVRPSNELSDYLLAQSLLAQHKAQTGRQDLPLVEAPAQAVQVAQAQAQAQAPAPRTNHIPSAQNQLEEMYRAGLQEVFGDRTPQQAVAQAVVQPVQQIIHSIHTAANTPIEVNAMRLAASKLPAAFRNRKFGRQNFHEPSQSQVGEPSS